MPRQGQPFTDLDELVVRLRAGRSRIVLVEGPERGGDAWILQMLLPEVADQVLFLGRGSWQAVQTDANRLETLLQEPISRIYTIRDRDFLPTEEVLPGYDPQFSGHHFVWRRYTIENYLLEPDIIWEAAEYLLSRIGRKPDSASGFSQFAAPAIERPRAGRCAVYCQTADSSPARG